MVRTQRQEIRLHLPTPDDTAWLAAAIGQVLQPGDAILLEGPIGAGKTHFCRSLIQSLLAADGRTEDVPSPTYTLVQTYETSRGEVWHADLYRLTSTADVLELGLDEAFGAAICLVEWPERLGTLAPARAVVLTLAPDRDGTGRDATVAMRGAGWDRLLRTVAGAANE